MNECVLDASAVLAYLQQETGWERVEYLLMGHRCHLSTVNWTEVLSRLADWGIPQAEAENRLLGLEIALVPFDLSQAGLAAGMRQTTRPLGLSLGDRACLALARDKGITAVTADRAWSRVDPGLGITIECIRPDGH